MNKLRNHFLLWPLTLIAVTLLIEYFIFGVIVLKPNSCLIMDNTDGRQIYFNILYHVKYGSGFTLSNQNYPFYECIFMTDAQAMLASLLNLIQHHLFSVDQYVVGIINGLIFYSIPLCSLFLYMIFKNIGIQNWIAATFALILCFLSPQMLRITAGHYGLSYLFYFPMLIYFLFRIHEKMTITSYVLVFLVVILFGLNNGHLSFAGSMLLLVFGFVTYLYHTGKMKFKGLDVVMLGMACLLCFYFIVRHYDKVTDREAIPWGFLTYYAQFESIFLPFSGKVLEFYRSVCPVEIAEPQEEGIAYIGIVGCLFSIFLIGRMMYFLVKKRYSRLLCITLNPKVNILLLSGLLILLYAMAFPFRFGMEDALERIPFLRQFRAPGRFAWVFYYALGIYITYTFNLVVRSRKVRHTQYAIPGLTILILLLYLQDIADYTHWYKRYLGNLTYFENIFKTDQDLQQKLDRYGVNRQNYSSIYGIPVCNQWNSKFGREAEQYDLVTPMLNIAYNLGIPWINSKLSRVSTSQTMATGQFVSSPLIKREIEPLIEPDKKILLICLKDYHPLAPEQYVIGKSKKLFEDEKYTYHEFQFRPDFYAERDSLLVHFEDLQAKSAVLKEQLIQSGCLVWKYAAAATEGFAVSNENADQLILDTVISRCGMDSNIEFSIWSRVDFSTDGAPYIKFVRKTIDNEVFDMQYLHSARAIDIQHGMLKLDYKYNQNLAKEKVSVYILKGKDHRFERLLIKPLNFNFYIQSGKHQIFNNYILE